ncbi:MAG: endonuclease/exonuclease/phosphatase family protein [Kiloniellaceae bacterium]
MPDLKPHLRAMTWNIHGCVGSDGCYDAGRVGAVVSALTPDIAAFQEVDSRRAARHGAPGAGKIYDVLRQLVGDHGHDAWSISGRDGDYGQILASRLPLEDRQVHDISVAGREARKVMSARIALPAATLRVVATHLGLSRHERRHQLAALREIIAADPATPLLLLGDFNEWFWPRRSQRELFELVGDWTRQASFPARFPLFALDRICCRPGGLLARTWTHRAARTASDHLPVLAELALPTPR